MGTARELVVGSGSWPACSWRVSKCCDRFSDIVNAGWGVGRRGVLGGDGIKGGVGERGVPEEEEERKKKKLKIGWGGTNS